MPDFSVSTSSEPLPAHHRVDIATREDIVRLVDLFYSRIRADGILGPIFDDVAHVDWSVHLPKMYDFWDAVLFGRAAFKGDPLGAHRALNQLTPLARSDFDRWVALFNHTVDEQFAGAIANEAKFRAIRIAMVMHHHIALDQQRDA